MPDGDRFDLETQMTRATRPIDSYRIFLAAPMSASSKQEYKQNFHDISYLQQELRDMRRVDTVYFAGEEKPNKTDFTPSPSDAFQDDVMTLADANIFIFIYPQKVLTSALIELGMALGMKKRTFIFVRNPEDLPYLLIGARDGARRVDFMPTISISTYKSAEELARKCKDRLYDIPSELAD
ncbi:MAG: hypothetical protein KTR21_06105 [Rhodobacteraceae bacterium]|nr:hypothetical protein [Paracoccaceae bacterium]